MWQRSVVRLIFMSNTKCLYVLHIGDLKVTLSKYCDTAHLESIGEMWSYGHKEQRHCTMDNSTDSVLLALYYYSGIAAPRLREFCCVAGVDSLCSLPVRRALGKNAAVPIYEGLGRTLLSRTPDLSAPKRTHLSLGHGLINIHAILRGLQLVGYYN